MLRNKSDPLLFDPELERTIRRRRAHERLVKATAMEGNNNKNNNVPDPKVEAQIEAAIQERLAQILRKRELQDANRSLRDQTASSMSYDYPGSIVYPNAKG